MTPQGRKAEVVYRNRQPGDKLNMAMFDALPHPLWIALHPGEWWPVESIDVQTGAMRIDVCGLLQLEMFGGAFGLRDAEGAEYHIDDFYYEDEMA